MRHKKTGKKIGRQKAPREMMLRNLASSVLIYEKVKTTDVKAKAVRSLVEKMITAAKKNDLVAKKKIIATLPQKMAVKKAIEVLGERYKDKKGGYTRLVKIGNRTGDGAKIVQIELI
jgi:large subunit ribosomal protein L17